MNGGRESDLAGKDLPKIKRLRKIDRWERDLLWYLYLRLLTIGRPLLSSVKDLYLPHGQGKSYSGRVVSCFKILEIIIAVA